MRNLTNDFENIIVKWLKSDDENATIPAYECNKLVVSEVNLCNKHVVINNEVAVCDCNIGSLPHVPAILDFCSRCGGKRAN